MKFVCPKCGSKLIKVYTDWDYIDEDTGKVEAKRDDLYHETIRCSTNEAHNIYMWYHNSKHDNKG
jgi:hypothetical protein